MQRTLIAAALVLASSAALAAPATYTIDASHTVVLASWNHMGFSNPSANFGGASGTLVYDAAKPEASTVEVTLPIASMDTFVPKLDEHLKGADFFDAGKYATATFKSTRVEVLDGNRLKVTGNLTLHGVTRPVVLDAVLNKVGENAMMKTPAIGFDATAKILRSDFGMGKMVPMVGDEITLRITTEAHGEKAAAAQ